MDSSEAMGCDDLAERITDMLEGDLEADEEAAALDHLATCERCELVLAETRNVIELSHEHGQAHVTNADRKRLFAQINAAAQGNTSG